MFDNPERDLKNLEDQLLALEGQKSRKEETPSLDETQYFLSDEIRNRSASQKQVNRRRQEQTRGKAKKPSMLDKIRDSQSDGLVAALLLEFAVLMGVIAWWILTP